MRPPHQKRCSRSQQQYYYQHPSISPPNQLHVSNFLNRCDGSKRPTFSSDHCTLMAIALHVGEPLRRRSRCDASVASPIRQRKSPSFEPLCLRTRGAVFDDDDAPPHHDDPRAFLQLGCNTMIATQKVRPLSAWPRHIQYPARTCPFYTGSRTTVDRG